MSTSDLSRDELIALIDERIRAVAVLNTQKKSTEAPKWKARIYIAITTFDRPDHFRKLVESLVKELNPDYHYTIRVYDDNSPTDYISLSTTTLPNSTAFRFTRNNGKKGYWRVIDRVFQDASQHQFDYFFLLQDDCTLVPNFFEKCITDWNSIEDIRKGSYCTFSPKSVYDRLMWGQARAKDVVYKGKKFIHTGYVDCIFMMPYTTLAMLDFTVEPIDKSLWIINPTHSSGVGKQLSGRIRASGKTMYGAWSSLVLTNEQVSKMNPRERAKTPLESLVRDESLQPAPLKPNRLAMRDPSRPGKYVTDRKICGIASIPSRESLLKRTLLSLAPQMDEIQVVLNGYSKPPAFANDPAFANVRFTMDDGKKGDANKFKFVDKAKGYYFSCDDDIIYPENYAEKMIAKVEEYGRKAIVTCHGRVVPEKKIGKFYKETRQHHFMFNQEKDIPVHIPGTGVSAFHTDTIKVAFDDFKIANMADIWLGLLAQKQGVKVVCIERKQRWLHGLKAPESIFNSASRSDEHQVDVVNSITWKLYG